MDRAKGFVGCVSKVTTPERYHNGSQDVQEVGETSWVASSYLGLGHGRVPDCVVLPLIIRFSAADRRVVLRESFAGAAMCRNIRNLFNFDPPATEAEIRDASIQFVRKISGFTNPSKANEKAFERAVEEVAASARTLIQSLVTTAEPRNRERESAKARALSAVRFGTSH